jgi:sec-independent protein translocase protein TatA
MTPLVTMPGGWELLLIVFVILLLFGAAKLPDLARGTGRALRIFKAETKDLRNDEKPAEEQEPEDHEPRGITSGEHVSQAQTADDPAKRARDN